MVRVIAQVFIAGALALGVCTNIDGVQDTIPPGYEAGPANEIGPTCVPADEANPGQVGVDPEPVPETTPVPAPEPEEARQTLPVTGGEQWWLIIPGALGIIAGTTLVLVNREEK